MILSADNFSDISMQVNGRENCVEKLVLNMMFFIPTIESYHIEHIVSPVFYEHSILLHLLSGGQCRTCPRGWGSPSYRAQGPDHPQRVQKYPIWSPYYQQAGIWHSTEIPYHVCISDSSI